LGKFPPCDLTAIELIRGCFLNKMVRLKHLRETTAEPENASEISTASADLNCSSETTTDIQKIKPCLL
jgi:hypothetical protein